MIGSHLVDDLQELYMSEGSDLVDDLQELYMSDWQPLSRLLTRVVYE